MCYLSSVTIDDQIHQRRPGKRPGPGPCVAKVPLNHVDHLAIPLKLTSGRFLMVFMRNSSPHFDAEAYSSLLISGLMHRRIANRQAITLIPQRPEHSIVPMSINFIKQCSDSE